MPVFQRKIDKAESPRLHRVLKREDVSSTLDAGFEATDPPRRANLFTISVLTMHNVYSGGGVVGGPIFGTTRRVSFGCKGLSFGSR
jgi:hypothetical protein